MHTHTNMHVHTCRHIYAYSTCMHSVVHMCIYKHTWIDMCMHMHTCPPIHTYTYVYIHTYTCVPDPFRACSACINSRKKQVSKSLHNTSQGHSKTTGSFLVVTPAFFPCTLSPSKGWGSVREEKKSHSKSCFAQSFTGLPQSPWVPLFHGTPWNRNTAFSALYLRPCSWRWLSLQRCTGI